LVWNKEKFDLGFFCWNRQHHCHHGVEGYRKTIALFAMNRASKLPVEQISDDGLIPQQVLVPGFQSSFLFVLNFFVVVLNIRLFAFPVEILTKQVKNGVDALVRVVLGVTLELLSIFAKDSFEHIWTDTAIRQVPHFIQCFGICHHQATLSTKRIFHFQVCHEFVLAF
jgi:hypothetical protein